MKLSLNWIKKYVDIPSNWDLSKIAYDLTMSTVEVEDMVDLSQKYKNIIVGQVIEVLVHPNADKLRIAKTDIGGGEIKDIVCGGSNLYEGMKVIVALPGSFVRWHGEGELVEIKATKLRGVDSFGMICSASEIGMTELFPAKEEAEIVDLTHLNFEAGAAIADALDLNDIILEIDNKSLTNRPDLWGHYGIARELSAIYNFPLKEIEKPSVPNVKQLNISIEEKELCSRYMGVELHGVTAKPSDINTQTLLWRVGVRPINAIVDITNYVMLATGQPTHAFDVEKVKGNIVVRLAKENEKLLLLNDEEVELNENDLVIADDEGAIGIAGVIGGKNDSVHNNTNKVVLEIANFNKLSIRRTALRHQLRTESSIRNEKGLDAERVDVALSVAMNLFNSVFPEVSVVAFADNFAKQTTKQTISLSLKWLKSRLGKDLSNDVIKEKLHLLGFETKVEEDNLTVVVPTWRATGDVSIPEDIVEEVARSYGFENFEVLPIKTTFYGSLNQIDIDIDRKIREYFAFRHNMNEVFSYPWINDDYLKAFSVNKEDMLALSAPPSPKEKYLRSTLLPNLTKAISGNLRYFNEFRIFESAQVFLNKDFKAKYDEQEKLPHTHRSVAGAFVADANKAEQLFMQVKGAIEHLPKHLHTKEITFEKVEKPFWADNVAWLNIMHENKIIGSLGVLSKKAALAAHIKNSAVALFEFNINELQLHLSRTNKFTSLPEYPMTDRDLSILINSDTKWTDIKEAIYNSKINKNLLQGVEFVDEYKGKQVPDGKKSVTLKLVIGSLEKTLTSDEIELCVNQVIKSFETKLGAEIR